MRKVCVACVGCRSIYSMRKVCVGCRSIYSMRKVCVGCRSIYSMRKVCVGYRSIYSMRNVCVGSRSIYSMRKVCVGYRSVYSMRKVCVGYRSVYSMRKVCVGSRSICGAEREREREWVLFLVSFSLRLDATAFLSPVRVVHFTVLLLYSLYCTPTVPTIVRLTGCLSSRSVQQAMEQRHGIAGLQPLPREPALPTTA
jgi:hypothetical protein